MTREPVITMADGHMVPLLNPLPDDIRIDDIIRALGRIPRFTGHTRRPLSVLEHSILVHDLWVEAHPIAPWPLPLYPLLHDAHEAYTGDIATPLKLLLGNVIHEIQAGFDQAIADAFGLHDAHWFHADSVKEADDLALRIEASALIENAEWVEPVDRKYGAHVPRWRAPSTWELDCSFRRRARLS